MRRWRSALRRTAGVLFVFACLGPGLLWVISEFSSPILSWGTVSHGWWIYSDRGMLEVGTRSSAAGDLPEGFQFGMEYHHSHRPRLSRIAINRRSGDVWLELPYWLPFLVAAAPQICLSTRRNMKAVRAHVAKIRRLERITRGRCPECGYDLRATPERCPECGTVVKKP